jgi:hypothetical protein
MSAERATGTLSRFRKAETPLSEPGAERPDTSWRSPAIAFTCMRLHLGPNLKPNPVL